MQVIKLVKLRRVELLTKLHLRATRYHLPWGITQCYLLPDTSELTPPFYNPSQRLGFTNPGGMEG